MNRRSFAHSRVAAAVAACALAVAPAHSQIPRLERLTEIGCQDCGDARQLSSTWWTV